MKLDGVHGSIAMTKGHDESSATPRRNLEFARNRSGADDERMVPRDPRRRGDSCEEPLPIVSDPSDVAVHRFGSAHDARTVLLGDQLMAEAYAEERPLTVPSAEQAPGEAGQAPVRRMSGPGREHHGIRIDTQRFRKRNGRAETVHSSSPGAERLGDVVHEGIFVIDE